MNIFIILCLALLADAALGEPSWLWKHFWHPVRVMGAAIDWCETRFNRGAIRKGKGTVVIGVLTVFALVIGWIIQMIPDFGILDIVVVAILVSQRSLSDHVGNVARGLETGLEPGRKAVAMIVGRDTAQLDQSDVARAAIESAAENLSDGVVAPVFWFLVLGLPGIFAYKLINTADSMIGHRSDRYVQFGWAAARLDDWVNFIPARLSAGLIIIASGTLRGWHVAVQDASLHRSPNAGWPEAAMAGGLNIALSGPRIYDGVATSDLFVNGAGKRTLDMADIRAANRILWRAWMVMMSLSLVTGVLTMTL